MENESSQMIVNGALVRSDEPSIPASSRGLMYGDGCFETCCMYAAKSFKLNAHLKRLRAGLDFLKINYPVELGVDGAQKQIGKLLQANQLLEGKSVVRLQVWRKGGRGYATEFSESAYMISASRAPESQMSYHLSTVSVPRIPSMALPSRFKLTNGINYITAANEARKKGADDALMQTINGWISETTIANIFWMKEGSVFTPSAECDLLPGTTREIILQLLHEKMGVSVEEGKYSVDELKSAEVVWICNSVKEIVPVRQVDQQQFATETSFIDELKAHIVEYRNGMLKSL